jgi:hypothetical protein
MLEPMGRLSVLVLIFLAAVFPPALLAETFTLTADQWARPRSGASIVMFSEINRLVEGLERQPEATLLIRHDPSDEGVLWAAELRSWFVALGIPSVRTRMQPDSGVRSRIEIELISN